MRALPGQQEASMVGLCMRTRALIAHAHFRSRKRALSALFRCDSISGMPVFDSTGRDHTLSQRSKTRTSLLDPGSGFFCDYLSTSIHKKRMIDGGAGYEGKKHQESFCYIPRMSPLCPRSCSVLSFICTITIVFVRTS